jgi:sulfatase modifying factor 1
MKTTQLLILAWISVFRVAIVLADTPETVLVGNPGNPADSTGYGKVPYQYRIGKYEVTNAEYCDFLNSAARNDRFELYDPRMASQYGGINRSGSQGSYTYSTIDGREKKPVGFVTWMSCVRFANWLSNGKDEADTEDGTYGIVGGQLPSLPDHAALAAGKTTHWALATENEWYKAAYYDHDKPGGSGYWKYAVKGDTPPECNLNSNSITEAGSYASSPSPSGTFDQNGNMWEYNETVAGTKVGLRGGSFYIDDNTGYLLSSTRYEVLSAKWPNYGFRVVALGSGKATARPGKIKPPPVPAAGPRRTREKTFYVSSSEGNDLWTGESASRKKKSGPWKTLKRASTEYIPGDKILLKRGDTWGEELAPRGNGTAARPITIGAYGKGRKPVIDRGDYKKDLTGIHLSDQGGFKIVGIEFNRCMTGIYSQYSDGCPTREYIWIEDCYFHDSLLYQHYEDYPKRKIGLGICFFSFELDKRVVLKDITIKNCVFRRLTSGVWTNSPDNFNKAASFVYNFQNMTFEDCLFEEGRQWQLGIRGVDTGAVRNCVTHDVGRNFRSFNGVAGAMFFRCKDWVFEDSEWGYISIGLGSGDGQAFDFEGNCDNMTMRNCLFHDTDGPGFLLCCYASDWNPHKGILMDHCVLNGKSKRPIGLPRCEIVNTTDWNESTWKNCRFYLSKGEALMRVMDPEKDKRTDFANCIVKDLAAACSTPKLPGKATASSEVSGQKAPGVSDDDDTTAWKPQTSSEPWVQIDFGRAKRVNEIKIREGAGSSVIRYSIDCWDSKTSRWTSCFNGREIGSEFVAPIVSRITSKVRLRIIRTSSGAPVITEFSAYNDTRGKAFNLRRGQQMPLVIGK